jgi:hypothetical protein
MPFDGGTFEKPKTFVPAGLAPPPENPVVQILREARVLLEKGWCQGVLSSCYENGAPTRFCMIGAIDQAARTIAYRDHNTPYSISAYAHDTVRKVLCVPRVSDWNDTRGRTKAQVLEVMDYAIAKAAGR